jgi:hypothetical protein
MNYSSNKKITVGFKPSNTELYVINEKGKYINSLGKCCFLEDIRKSFDREMCGTLV